MIQLRSFLRCVTEHCVTRFEVCYDYQETTTAAGYNNIIGFISSVLGADGLFYLRNFYPPRFDCCNPSRHVLLREHRTADKAKGTPRVLDPEIWVVGRIPWGYFLTSAISLGSAKGKLIRPR